jgi:deoxyribose-phosphate aldolase
MNPNAKDHASPPDFTDASVANRVAGRIQSTLISNTVTEGQWRRHISECIEYCFHGAMIPGSWVRKTVDELRGTGVRVASFIDLPLGTMTSTGKAREAGVLVQDGVQEIDLMPNVGFLLSGMEREYFNDVRGVVRKPPPERQLRSCWNFLASMQQRERAVRLALAAGVAYLKNASSGSGDRNSVGHDFSAQTAPPDIKLKAFGRHQDCRSEFSHCLRGQIWSARVLERKSCGSCSARRMCRGISNPAY